MTDRSIQVTIGAALSGTFRSAFAEARKEVQNFQAVTKKIGTVVGSTAALDRQSASTRQIGLAAVGAALDVGKFTAATTTAAAAEAKLGASGAAAAAGVGRVGGALGSASAGAEKLAGGLGKAAGGADKLGGAAGGASGRVDRVAAAMSSASNKTNIVAERMGRAATSIARVRAEEDALASATARANRELERQARMPAPKVGATHPGLGVGTAAAAAGMIAPGLALKSSISAAGDFEHALAAFGNTADASEEKVGAVREQILKTAKDVNQSSMDLIGGLGILVGKGLDQDKSMAAIGAIGKTATATGSAISDLSDTAFTLIDTLDIKPEKLAKSLDMLAKAGKEGGFEIKNMAKYFPTLGAAAKSVGMVGEPAIASMGAALQVALKGAGSPDEAANNMRNFFQKMASKETTKNIRKEMGVNLEELRKGWAKEGKNPMEETLKLIDKHLGTDPAVRDFRLNELFQDAQVQNFIKPMLQNFKEYERIREATAKALGVVDKDFARIMETFNEKSKAAKIAVWGLGEAVGRALIPGLNTMLGAITPVVEKITGFASANPKLVAGLVGVGAALVAIRLASMGIKFLGAITGMTRLIALVSRFRAGLALASAAQAGLAVAGAGAGAIAGGAGSTAAAAAAGATVATMTVGALVLGVGAAAAFAAIITAIQMPKEMAKQGPGAFDPATGGIKETNPMEGMSPDRPWLTDWFKDKFGAPKPRAPLTVQQQQEVEESKGIRRSTAPTLPGKGAAGFGLDGPREAAPGPTVVGPRTEQRENGVGIGPTNRPLIPMPRLPSTPAPAPPKIAQMKPIPVPEYKIKPLSLDKTKGPVEVKIVPGSTRSPKAGGGEDEDTPSPARQRTRKPAAAKPEAESAPAAAPAAPAKGGDKNVSITISAPVSITATGVGLQEVAAMIASKVNEAIAANNVKIKAELTAQMRSLMHD